MPIQYRWSFKGAKFNNTLRNNWKPLFEVNFSKNSTKTIKLFALDFYEVIFDWAFINYHLRNLKLIIYLLHRNTHESLLRNHSPAAHVSTAFLVLLNFHYVFITHYVITNSMHAFWLVNQLWFIVPVNSWKNRESSALLYKSNRPQVSMVYRLINHLGCW